jgi:anti-sigma factor RsiW
MSRFGKPEKTTEHQYFEERLSAYLDGELLPQEREVVKHHLSTCQACQWDFESLSKTVQWTRELPTVPVPRVFTIQVPAKPQRAERRGWSFVPALQAATAVVALLLFFAVTGDFLLGGFRMARAPEMIVMELPVSEATQVVELAREAPPAAPQASEAVVVETVVVEVQVEVEKPVEVQAEKQAVQPTAAPLATAAPEPAGAEEAEVAPDEVAAPPPGLGGVEGEAQADERGLAAVLSPTVPMANPLGAGGESEPMALTAPVTDTALPIERAAAQLTEWATEPTEVVAVPPGEPQPEWPTDQARGRAPAGALQEPVSLGLRLIEYGLGALLLLLAVTTLAAMVQRRRSR